MPKTISEVRQQLSAIEPSERTYEGLGPADVDVLTQLLDDDEPWLAARAVHALSRITADSARDALRAAAASPRMEVRVAAAASAESLSPDLSDEILSTLLDDSQAGVRKFAIRSTSDRNSEPIKRRVRELATTDQDPGLQRVAEEKTRSISPP